MQYWLVKQEPLDYSWAEFAADQKTIWSGVRNPQARNYLAAMHEKDTVLFYHSGLRKTVVGIASVSRKAFTDPTDPSSKWLAVELKAERPLPKPVTLSTIKADPLFNTMPLVRQPHLSVMPITREQFERIIQLGH